MSPACSILRIVLAITSLLYAVGLCVADTNGGAYNKMIAMAPAYFWAMCFALYSFLQLRIAFRKMAPWAIYAITIFGFIIWIISFASFAENPNRALGAADLMTLFLPGCDLWTGANALTERRNARRN